MTHAHEILNNFFFVYYFFLKMSLINVPFISDVILLWITSLKYKKEKAKRRLFGCENNGTRYKSKNRISWW